MTNSWDIIAGEYPPDNGGVADYTRAVAKALVQRGDVVRVWQRGEDTLPRIDSDGIVQYRCAGEFTRPGLSRVEYELERIPNEMPGQRRLLVQYVPNAFGCRGMNVQFARWVRNRAENYNDDVRIMFHEVAYPWVRWPLKHNLIAAANRWMAYSMIRHASKLYVSTTAWTDHLVRLGAKSNLIELLAIPSNIPESQDRQRVQEIQRSLVAPGMELLLGHFGTFGKWVAPSLKLIIQELLRQHANVRMLLLGGGSSKFRAEIIQAQPHLESRIIATGRLATADLANHICACDVMLQPFPDGANTRRTSLMACLINGIATVSNSGCNTEPIWSETNAVALAQSTSPGLFIEQITSLLGNKNRRLELAKRGKDAYDLHFQLSRTIETVMA